MKAIFIIGKLDDQKVDAVRRLGFGTVVVGSGNIDKEYFRKLKEMKIRIYVEVTIFAGEDLWERYPDCRPVAKNGQVREKNNWYLGVCPSHPSIRQEKLKKIDKIIQIDGVDGIILDFIRYPCHWEDVRSKEIVEYCFCQNCLEQFTKEFKGPPEGGSWFKFKSKQIIDFVKKVKDLIISSKKEISLGVFTVPWKEDEFDGAIKKIICQDFRSLAGFVDFFSPMVYHKMLNREVDWIGNYVSYLAKLTGKLIFPIIQTEDKPEKISPEEFRSQIKEANKSPSCGAIIFFLEDLLKDKAKIEVLQ